MRLNGLHDVCKEAFALLNETVLPHLVGNETDKVGREQDLLDHWGARRAWRGDLESADEILEDVLVEMLDILHEPYLLFGGIVVDVG